jgi:hypothetical protein
MAIAGVFAGLLVGVQALAGNTVEASKPPAMPPQERILDCLKRTTALDSSFGIDKVEIVPLAGLNIPFLSAQIKEKKGIRVRLIPGKIKWSGPREGSVDRYVRYFAVYLDAEANRVLAVTSRLEKRSSDIHPDPSPEVMAAQLSHASEAYEAFPTADPKVTFMEALEAVCVHGVGYPPLAQEIDGFYLMDSRATNPVWIINLRGLPPLPATSNPGGGKLVTPPIWKDNHLRNVVDAATGKWLFGTNIPGPE